MAKVLIVDLLITLGLIGAWLTVIVYCACILSGRQSRQEEQRNQEKKGKLI